MTIKAALNQAIQALQSADSKSAKLDAELILAKLLGHPREWLIGNDTSELEAQDQKNYEQLIKRRLGHEPVSYINQSIEFYGLDFFVDKRVLSPRVETELIVEQAIKQAPKGGRLLDMGTGSGAIAIAISKHRPDLKISASEISAEALEVAKINAEKILGKGHKIKFVLSDIWDSIADSYDVVATNLPYVSENYKPNMKPEVLQEPAVALFGGKQDGLDLYRRFYQGLSKHTKQAALVFHESDPWQHDQLKALAAASGLEPILEDYLILGFRKTA